MTIKNDPVHRDNGYDLVLIYQKINPRKYDLSIEEN